MKRLFSLCLVLILALGLLAGCGGDDKKDDASSKTDAPVADDGIFSTEDVKFVGENGEALYRIIRSQEFSGHSAGGSSDAANYVSAQLRMVFGTNFRSTTDDNDGTDTYEILVGDTNRPETKIVKDYFFSASNGLKEEYIIGTVGKKIVIYSTDFGTLKVAAEYFIKNYAKAEGVQGGIKYVFKSAEKGITVNGATLTAFKVVRSHYNESYIVQAQIDEMINTANGLGHIIEYVEDQYVTEGDYEIVVGNANRKGVTEITNRDEYKITIQDKKVYINGGSPQATAIAVAEFGKMLSKVQLTNADSVSGTYSETVKKYDRSKYYTLTWGDDFDGDSVDPTLWYHVPETAYSSDGFNNRTAIRSKDPNYVFVADGKFHINSSFNDTQYIGGMLMTDRTMLYKYGYLEMSAILPDAPGLWTSLWLDSRWHGQNGKQPDVGVYYDFEIDVNECFGNASAVAANCHKWPTSFGEKEGYEHTSLDVEPYSRQKRRAAVDEGHNFGDGFHTFGLLWDETQMTFTCDGEPYFTYEINKTVEDLDGFHALCYIRLSAAIGFSGNPLGTIIDDNDERWYTRNKFVIDYVHIYQLQDGKQQLVTGDAIWQ